MHQLRAGTQADLGQIHDLLARVFPHPPRIDLLEWYLDEGRRSECVSVLVTVEAGRVTGHIAGVVSEYTIGNDRLRAVHPINWAVEPGVPATTGLRLMLSLIEPFDLALVVGGTEIARQILPPLGYQHRADFRVFVKVFSKIGSLAAAGRHGWKGVVREARWLLRGGLRHQGSPASAGEDTDPKMIPVLVNTGSSAHIDWLARSPVERAHVVRLKGEPGIGFVQRDGRGLRGRIVRLPQGELRQALAASERSLLADGCCSVSIATTDPVLGAVFEKCGYTERDHHPLWVRDPSGRLGAGTGFALDFMEGDNAFLPVS